MALAGVAGLAALWAAWFLLAEVSVYAVSSEARLEVERAAYPVDAPVDGRLVAVHAVLGRPVKEGELLFELDAEDSRRGLAEQTAAAEALASEIELLEGELETARQALTSSRREAGSARDEQRELVVAASAAAELARSEAERLERLHAEALVSDSALSQARSEARQKEAALAALDHAGERLRLELVREEEERRGALERLRRELRSLQGERSVSAARVERARHQLELFYVRAPAAGRLAELADLKPGSWLGEGTKLATVVPDGGVRAVALFAPAQALGRVKPGQPARLTLEGFPWAQYGAVGARVGRVSGEVRDGLVRVELVVEADGGGFRGPLRHGLPGTAEVEVERVSPAALVLRNVGKAVTGES